MIVADSTETVAQDRTLTNAGLRSDLAYVKGIHNLKIGTTYQQTFLKENDKLGSSTTGSFRPLRTAVVLLALWLTPPWPPVHGPASV